METNSVHLETAKYVNSFAKRHNQRVRVAKTRSFMQIIGAFVLGLGAMAAGLYAIEHFDVWYPYVQYWVRQTFNA